MSTKVSNSAAVYIIMLVASAAGIWAILAYGSTLSAAPDLAGEWIFVDSSTGESLKGGIDQSGHFVQFRLGSNAPLECRLSGSSKEMIRLDSPNKFIEFTPTNASEEYRVVTHFDSESPRTFIGRIVTRTYPRPRPATRPTTA